MRKHRFTDKHPMIASILICFFLMILCELIPALFRIVHYMIAGTPSELMSILYMVIGSLFVFLLYKWWFAPDFEGALKGGNLREGFSLELPFIIYWVVTGIAMVIDHTFELKTPTLTILRVSLTAGLVEELSFRHGIVSTLFRKHDQKEDILKVCVFSGIVFGLFHMANVLAGADPISTIVQVITAGCHGVFFASVYVRCGNLWPCIILHAVHDIYAITTTAEVSEEGIITGGITFSSIVDAIACIELATFAIIRYLSPDQREKIVRLWDGKWNRKKIEAVEGKEELIGQ